MDGDGLFTIGALARRTGLTVKTIRFYSDCQAPGFVESGLAGFQGYLWCGGRCVEGFESVCIHEVVVGSLPDDVTGDRWVRQDLWSCRPL